MKITEFRTLIREEVKKTLNKSSVSIAEGFLGEAKLKKTKEERFLREFNYQRFDDWYKMYNKFVEGDLEPEDSRYAEFIEDTGSIMKFLENALKKSK